MASQERSPVNIAVKFAKVRLTLSPPFFFLLDYVTHFLS